MTVYETDNVRPYFSNLDDDAFRSNRFMYILRKEMTVFGSKGGPHTYIHTYIQFIDLQLVYISMCMYVCMVLFMPAS